MALSILILAALASVCLGRLSARGAVRASSILQVFALAVAGLDASFCLAGYDEPGIGIAHAGSLRLPGTALDPLAAVVAIALALVGIPIAISAPSHLAARQHRLPGPLQQALLPLLEGAILVVLCSRNALVLLLAWELMTVLVIVLAGGRGDEGRAGWSDVVLAHVGTAALVVVLVLLASAAPATGFLAFDWDALRVSGHDMTSGAKAALLLVALAGVGTRAGILPLEALLPEARPAASFHVSALLSSVAGMTGVYVLVRLALDLARPVPLWFGIVFLGVGFSSALLGALLALRENDLRRLLAFHGVENVGIVFLGIGVGVVAAPSGPGLETVASLALASGLFHLVNHATTKALLFLCAGSVHATLGVHDLEKPGGLQKSMRWTGLAFLAGALGISCLPPGNGFASQWSLVQALVACARSRDAWLRGIAPLLVAGLAIAGALAAACLARAFGAAFTGAPRSDEARQAREVSRAPLVAQGLLVLFAAVLAALAPLALMMAARGGEPLGVLPYLTFESPTEISGKGFAAASPAFTAACVTGVSLVLGLATRGLRARARTASP